MSQDPESSAKSLRLVGLDTENLLRSISIGTSIISVRPRFSLPNCRRRGAQLPSTPHPRQQDIRLTQHPHADTAMISSSQFEHTPCNDTAVCRGRDEESDGMEGEKYAGYLQYASGVRT